MQPLVAVLLFLQERTSPELAQGTGLEWMVIASGLVPAVLLLIIIYAGSKQTV